MCANRWLSYGSALWKLSFWVLLTCCLSFHTVFSLDVVASALMFDASRNKGKLGKKTHTHTSVKDCKVSCVFHS